MSPSFGTDPPTEAEIRRQEAIAEFSRRAFGADSVDELLRDATLVLVETLDANYASAFEARAGDDEAVLRQGVGWPAELLGTATVPLVPDSRLAHTLRTAEPVVVADVQTGSRFVAPDLFTDHDIVGSVSVVVGPTESPWGVLGAHMTDRREFTEGEAAFVRSVANVLAAAIEATLTRHELEEIYGRISDAFFALDEEWHFTYINERAHDIINPDDRGLVGKDVWDEFPAATERKFKPEYERAMYEQTTVSFEEYYPEPLDEWFEVRAYPSETGLSVYFQAITERKEREQRLRESEQRYRTLAESFPNGIVTLYGDDLRYTLAAGGAFEYLSATPADVEDHTPREVWGDDVADVLEPALETALDGTEQNVEVEYAGQHWNVHAVPVTDDDGEVFGGMTVAQDITERKEREAELATQERALRTAYELIADGSRSAAEQIDALLALGRQVLGTDYATFSHIHGDSYEFESVAVAAGVDLEAGESAEITELPICERVYRTEEPLVLSDVARDAPELVDPMWGIACYLGAPVVVDGTTYGTFCFYDVEPRSDEFSDWERTFVELLSDWVGSELTRRRTTEQLQQQNERLDEFASVVSHDLRNPLNVAEGRLMLAREEHDNEHLESVERAHTRIQSLIDDLLVLAREGNEVTDRSPVDLSSLASACWEVVETGDATLVVDIDRTVRADASRLKQLFENLIRNSVEHGSTNRRSETADAVEHGGADVTITVGALDDSDGFYVADDGPGIPESARTEVFEPGFSTGADGTGFGLSIVKQVAEAHGWSIRAVESADGGARFEITGVAFE